MQCSMQWFNTPTQPCAESTPYRHGNGTPLNILAMLLPVLQIQLVPSMWPDTFPIVKIDLDRCHLSVNDAVISLGNTMILGFDGVSVSVGHRLLSMVEEVMAARSLEVIVVLSWVGGLVLKYLEDLVAAESQERTHKWADVVDPVVTVEANNDRRTERSSRVDGCACPVGRTDVGNEDRDTDADGCEVGATVLLYSEEVDS